MNLFNLEKILKELGKADVLNVGHLQGDPFKAHLNQWGCCITLKRLGVQTLGLWTLSIADTQNTLKIAS